MKVFTTIEAWNKMSYWAALGGKEHREFTCFGRAVHEDGQLRVTDCYLVKQEGTSGGVDGDDADINRLIMELYQQGIEPDEAFRCWIHSHPGTGPTATYLSGTDDENIERYLTGQWLISIVLDSKGDNPFCQVDVKEPRMSIKAEIEIELPKMSEAVKTAAKADFSDKSSGRTYTSWKPGSKTGVGSGARHGSFGGYGGGHGDFYDGGYPYARSGSSSGSSAHRGSHSGPSSSGEKAGESGKVNGAAARGTSKSSGAGDDKGTGSQTELDGMLMLGGGFMGDQDEYDAWMEYAAAEQLKEAIPAHIPTGDTEEITEIDVQELEVQSLDASSVPEWVVSMADKMACTVEDLCSVVDIKQADEVIDKIVERVQCGYMQMDAAIEDLTKMGIEKGIATKELDTRVNA
jgi:hypothetical protein